MERRTYNDACGTVARYERDKRRMAELREEIIRRYKGAIAGQPIGHNATDCRTGDPEARSRDIEKLEMDSVLAKRIEAVGLAFNDLRADRYSWGWYEKDTENLILAIQASCDNRKLYAFYGLQQKFKLPFGQDTFIRAKFKVLYRVAELLEL